MYYYNGSLSWPDCTEGVKWFVYSEAIQFQSSYATLFTEVIVGYGNYRTT